MHRTLIMARGLFGAALLALLLSGLPGVSHAQPQPTGVSGTAIIVPLGGTVQFQMKTKKPIAKVTTPKETVLTVRTMRDKPDTLLLTGLQPELTTLTVEDIDGAKETYDIVVQRDVEYLRTQLRRAVPTAVVVVTPIAETGVLLNGTVTNPEDVAILSGVAESLNFKVINAMKVGGVQQVQLDVVIAEVSRSDTRSLDFNFLTQSPNFYFAHQTGGAVSGLAAPTAFGTLLSGAAGSANILTGTLHTNWSFLAFINALKSESLAKIVSEPHQIGLSGRPSVFQSGGQQPIPSGGGINGVGAQFIPFGTNVTCTPIILGNGKIYLEITATQEDLNAAESVSIGGASVAGRTTNSINTTVELESGQTFVIGGMIKHTVTASTDKIPVIGELPFFGVFFSNKLYNEEEDETLILVTPHLIDAQDSSQVNKILPGYETRRPDDFELFLEGIMEAPRGQREVFQDCRYIPAYKNGPSAEQFPCAANSLGGLFGNRGGCAAGCNGGGVGGCNGGCGANPNGGRAQTTAPAGLPPMPANAAGLPPMPADAVDVKTPPATPPTTLPASVGTPEGDHHE